MQNLIARSPKYSGDAGIRP